MPGGVTELERATAAALHRALTYGTFLVLPLFVGVHLAASVMGTPSAFVRHHTKQAALVHGAFGLVSIATLGLGFLVLAIPVWIWTRRAAEEARRGEWTVAPVIGWLADDAGRGTVA